eukprot:2873401-Rhodomonas_salina.1
MYIWGPGDQCSALSESPPSLTHAVPAVPRATSLCPAASLEAALAWGGLGARACACPATCTDAGHEDRMPWGQS